MARFLDKAIERKMCILNFYTPSVRKISHSKKEFSDILSQMHTGFHVKYPLLSGFNES